VGDEQNPGRHFVPGNHSASSRLDERPLAPQWSRASGQF
jgi:hypothetical protein